MTVKGWATYLFTRAHTSIDFMDQPSSDHLEQNDPRPRVQHLLIRRPVRFILLIRIRTRPFPIHTHSHLVRLLDLRQPRRIFRKRRKLIGSLIVLLRSDGVGRGRRDARSIDRRKRSHGGGVVRGGRCSLCVAGMHGQMLFQSIVLLRKIYS